MKKITLVYRSLGLLLLFSLLLTACENRLKVPTSVFSGYGETKTPTPQETPCSITTPICLSSAPSQNLVFSDAGNAAPAFDASGRDWTDPNYLPDSSWTVPVIVTNPPQPEWNLTCGPSWISTTSSGWPASLADTYYRNRFTLPPDAVPQGTLSFSVDDGVDIWVNGVLLASYPGSLTTPDPTRLYHICTTVAVPFTVLKAGVNVLAFRVRNLATYEGLNYSLCLTCAATGIVDKGN